MKYFNFPISLLYDFNDSTNEVLNNISNFAFYKISSDINGSNKEKLDYAAQFFGVTINNPKALELGKKLYNAHGGGAMVGISKDMYFDFLQNDNKTEFDKICLLAFLGLKSIIGKSEYTKTNFKLMFSRMSGYHSTTDSLEISLLKYTTRRKRERIMDALQDNWHLKMYSYHTRGFYVSFDLTREELIKMAEGKKKKTKKQERQAEDKRVREALKSKLQEKCTL